MREIVIVITDLYLPPDPAEIAGSSALPGLERIARFGRRRTLEGEGGWRPWLARALGRSDLAEVPPAAVVAARLRSGAVEGDAAAADTNRDSPGIAPSNSGSATETRGIISQPPESTVWLATPLHLIAGLTSLHLDRRSLLRLSAAEAEGFAADFNQTFGGPDPVTERPARKSPVGASLLRLHPLHSGEFLLEAPASFAATTTEPARVLVEGLESSLPTGPQATECKRLGAELEMWLHTHPLNDARRRRSELPVSTLWLWGGGPASTQLGENSAAPRPAVFGHDPYLAALASLGRPAGPGDPDLLVAEAEVTSLLHADPQWTLFDAVADIDRRIIAPTLNALNERCYEAVTLIANNVEMCLHRSDRLKFWRPRQPGLTGLIVQ